MKKTPRQPLLGAMLACFGALTLAALAQTPPAPEPTPAASAPAVAASDSTANRSPEAPATTTPAPAPAANVDAPAAVAPKAEAPLTPPEPPKEPELRRIDAPAPVAPAAENTTPTRRERRVPGVRIQSGGNGNDRVAVGQDVQLGKNESANSVVSVFGSATSEGEVSDAVVSILGNTRVTGPVGDSAVAVLGNTYVDASVNDVVAVLGNVELGPNADVRGDVVAVGGDVIRDPKAVVRGQVQKVGFGKFGVGEMDGLRAYFTQCVLKLRPLAIGPHLAWAWAIALSLLLVYIVLALLFRGGVEKCVLTLETRPGSSILAALLTLLLSPVLIVLLCITVVGIAVVPFLAFALFCAGLFGKAVMLAWIGRRITRLLANDGPLAHPAVAVLIGGVLMLGLYLIPVAGIILYKVLGVLGLGVVIYTLLAGNKRERAVAAAAVTSAPVLPVAAMSATGGAAAAVPMVGVAPAPAVPPPAVAAVSLPRAGFWIRIAALLIDVVLVGIITSMLEGLIPHSMHIRGGPPAILPLLALYGALMWKLKGTTIGGIVCGLRVVRLDGREIDWATAIVRALGCFLSLVIVGLGFIWVAIDDEKQSWHDKIAGTTIVHAPRGVSLV